MHKKGCVFCRISLGETYTAMIREGKNIISLLDRFPRVRGHVLVIPREHYENITEMPESVLCEIIKEIKLLEKALKKAGFGEGFEIRQNYWPWIPETQYKKNHVHFHLIPRFKDKSNELDGFPTPEELEEVARKIKRNMK